MKYYKLINNNTFIGVVHSGAFVKENANGTRLFYSDELRGEFVDYKGLLYRDYWMTPTHSSRNYTLVTITEITEEEYDTLKEAIDNNEEIEIDDDEEEEPITPPPEDAEPDILVEFTRESKLKQMSNMCRTTIEAGFDLILRGETHHFSLTTQDQLNLMSLNLTAQTEELIPYHADGEEVTFYTAEEINQIIAAAAAHKNYQLAYYNSLKVYINALDNMEDIAAVAYGTPIPDEYKSDVLRVLE